MYITSYYVVCHLEDCFLIKNKKRVDAEWRKSRKEVGGVIGETVVRIYEIKSIFNNRERIGPIRKQAMIT